MIAAASRLALVTGTAGLGFAIARGLADAGVEVILAGRNPSAGNIAVADLRRTNPKAVVTFAEIDLGDLNSVRRATDRLAVERDRLDILVNSAGLVVMARGTTASGAELMFGTNHLGHFALTGQLLPLLSRSADARVVSIVGAAYRSAAIAFDDLNSERGFNAMKAGGQSMLAKALFAQELQRRSDANDWGLKSLAADPGLARTGLLRNAPAPMKLIVSAMTALMGQSAADGARPALFAALDAAEPGALYAPASKSGLRGPAARRELAPSATDRAAAARLWEVSQGLTGSPFPG